MVMSEDKSTREAQPLYKKILVPIDKAGYKGKVIIHGIKLAKALGSEITVIHVIDDASFVNRGTDGDDFSHERNKETYQEAYEDAIKKQAEKILGEARLIGEKEGIRVDTEVVNDVQSVAEAIIEYAKKKNFDLILLGTKGLSGLEKFLLSSIASQIISHAHCPVLAVR
jgi:nucleotide-binding universal stress UspA family protein